jgi:hypothetical protein
MNDRDGAAALGSDRRVTHGGARDGSSELSLALAPWPILHEVFTYVIYGGWGFSPNSLQASVRSGVIWRQGGGHKELQRGHRVDVGLLRLQFFFLSDQSGEAGAR